MDAKQFAVLFPKLYHLTFTSNLESIDRHGLRSSVDLADALQFDPDEQDAALGRRRLCIQQIRGASLRDQHTAPESKMKSCLVKIAPAEWLGLLNAKIFFFLSEERALRLAGSYADYQNTILETDTRALLADHAADVTVCRINSGSFLFRAVPRGRDSFIPLANFVYESSRNIPAELTLPGPIPNILAISQVRSVS